nr:hypothetical protein CFP56_11090 [Quercus suber]
MPKKVAVLRQHASLVIVGTVMPIQSSSTALSIKCTIATSMTTGMGDLRVQYNEGEIYIEALRFCGEASISFRLVNSPTSH